MQPLFAGLQVIMPGETAPSHRHTQSRLRFVVEGPGAYKAVACERTQLKPGDFIIIPSWTFHDHGQQGLADVEKPEGISAHRYAANLLPLRVHANKNPPFGQTSPIFSYPYDRTLQALHQLESHADLDPWDGTKLRYVKPLTGGSPMPTLATFMQRLPAGFAGKPYRQAAGAVYSVVKGHRSVHAERSGQSVRCEFATKGDFVIPSWHTA